MTEEITQYYFALYAKAGREIFPSMKTRSGTRVPTDKFDHMVCYDKSYFSAYLYPSSYDAFSHDDCEELSMYAKDCEEDIADKCPYLKKGEWIQDLHDCKLVCLHPETEEEVDAYEYYESLGYEVDWTESGSIKFSSWCDEEDLP